MKKLTLTILVLCLTTITFAAAVKNNAQAGNPEGIKSFISRDVPEWSFVTTPIQVMSSFYDYMPGSYNSSPIKLQNNEQSGVYLAYHATENLGANRRVFYGYYGNGQLTTTYISPYDVVEGYAGLDVDKVSGDAMFIWHTGINGAIYDDYFAVDRYSLLESPGLFSTPYNLIDNSDDEFIWPYVYIIPSPEGEPYRRIIIMASNNAENDSNNPNENPIIAYYDYTSYAEIENLTPQDWTMYTIDEFDTWRENDLRPFCGMTVSKDGKLAFIGSLRDIAAPEDIAYPENDKLFVVYNDNFGAEESWQTFLFEPTIPIPNIENYFKDPSTQEPYTDIRYTPGVTGHDNSVFDSQGRVHTNMVFNFMHEDNFYTTDYSTSKHVIFTPPSEGVAASLDINDVYPLDGNLNDEYPYLPWDPDGNGPIWEEDVLLTQRSIPYFWWSFDNLEAQHDEYVKAAVNGNWMVTVLGECTNAFMYNEHSIDDYADWAEVPEILIIVSGDYGQTWSEPIAINSRDIPEFSGMIPCYSYVCERIVQIDETHGKLLMMFYDDNSYGSFNQGNGIQNGGRIMYTELSVDFGVANDGSDPYGYEWVDADENYTTPSESILQQNSPNPFNPNTKISFNLKRDDKVELSVFNLKGQKIITLANDLYVAGEHSVNWNGKDDKDEAVGSGVYLYQIKTSDKNEIKKMILLK